MTLTGSRAFAILYDSVRMVCVCVCVCVCTRARVYTYVHVSVISEQSRSLQPLSSVYFEEDTGEMKILKVSVVNIVFSVFLV